jgi:diguanylate cyclase (GGDEF)-like protein
LTWANQAAKDYLALREDATGSYASDAWRAMEAFGLPADAAERRETRIHTEEGVERWALVSTTTLRISGRPSQLVSLVDVSELKAIQSELLVASLTDGLTGLYNRRYLFLKLAEEIERARRFAYGFSIALFDLDHFKGVNDTFGHRVGDEVLIRVATELRRSIREVDFAGRYGGEEFLVILPYANTAVALDVAERIRAGIDALTWSKPGLRVTLSGGVCEYAGTDIDTLVDAADRRLYEAKAAGRDRVIG